MFWDFLTLAVVETLGAEPKGFSPPGGSKVKGDTELEMGRKQNFLGK